MACVAVVALGKWVEGFFAECTATGHFLCWVWQSCPYHGVYFVLVAFRAYFLALEPGLNLFHFRYIFFPEQPCPFCTIHAHLNIPHLPKNLTIKAR